MKIRRFFAPDMRRAIQLVRTEHGADAVILSSRAVEGGMEIVSAVDYDEELIAQMVQPGARTRSAEDEAAAGREQVAGGAWEDAAKGSREDAAANARNDAGARIREGAAPSARGREGAAVSARGREGAAASAGDDVVARAAEDVAASVGEAVPFSTRQDATARLQEDGLSEARVAVPDSPNDASLPRRALAGRAAPAAEAGPPRAGVSRAVAADRTAAVIRADREASPPRGAAFSDGAALDGSTALEAALSRIPASPPPTAEAPREDPSIAALRNELLAMRSMLCRQLSQFKWADRRMLEPERALLATRVAGLGLDDDLAETLVSEIEDPGNERAWREVMYGLARRLDVPKEDPLEEGGVFALVGPTGVGKTTTIAKLAARHCLRHGRESLALISTDTLRIGAQRQLDAYGAILGVPVRQASGPGELVRLLGALADRRLVLIDTAGLSSRDRRLAAALGQLEADRRVRRLVVLPATMQPAVMHEAVTAFGGDALAGAVLTKLDETDSLGAALSVLIRRKLTAMWLSHGQRVPEDLKLARIIHLLRWALDEPRFTAPKHDTGAPWNSTLAAEVTHAGV